MSIMTRADGGTSRTMRDVLILSMLVAFESSMAAFQAYIPDDYLWLYPVAHTLVLMRMAYLRVTTTMPMASQVTGSG
jgi:hypothetical protein